MKKLILLLIPGLLLLAACAPSRYVWQHESGLGETDLQQAQKVCDLYAAKQTPPDIYWDYPYVYGGYPFYYGGYGYSHRYRHHSDYYPYSYFSGINTYAYQQDLSRACLKGRGWDRITIEEG